MKRSRILALALISSAAAMFSTQVVAADAPSASLTDDEWKEATQIYFDRCAGCHGMLRKGALGPALEPEKTKAMGTPVLEAIIYNGTPGGMPDWGASGEMSKEDTNLMARYIQLDPPAPPEKNMADMKKSWKVLIPVDKRPTKPEGDRNWKNYFGVILRDIGKIAIVDGDKKDIISVVDSGFATHILRTSKSGRYMYVIGRDGKASMIDLWMKKPENVAEIRTCNDARSLDTSKYNGPKGNFDDKLVVVGCYWPPSIVVLDGPTLEPKKIVATGSYTYDTEEYLREARVASIVASHHDPEWVINIKETGQVWLYNYENIDSPTITMIESERFLHDGGWDLSKRYFLVAANAKNKVVAIDTQEKKLAGIIDTKANKPHPGRGVNIDHSKYGPIWGTGHIGDNVITFIGTDPEKHPDQAWKIVKETKLPGEGGGNLFIKSHPNSKYIFVDRPLNPDRDLQTQIYVLDKETLEVVKTLPMPEEYKGEFDIKGGAKVKMRGPVHFEYNQAGTEVWTSIWGHKELASPILVYDANTLELKNVIKDDRLRTPTGKFNVANTMDDIY
jgi:nitrite reductase (NO-forming)/hydroxylamine reductase